MKTMKKMRIAAMVLVPALVAFPANAEDENGSKEFGKKMFDEADINGDGIISGGEHEDAKRSKFTKGDADGDGLLSYEEAVAQFRQRQEAGGFNGGKARGGPGGERMFAVLDIDRDGVVSFDEFSVMGDRRFKNMDANLDGEVTYLEAQAEARERMTRHRKRR